MAEDVHIRYVLSVRDRNSRAVLAADRRIRRSTEQTTQAFGQQDKAGDRLARTTNQMAGQVNRAATSQNRARQATQQTTRAQSQATRATNQTTRAVNNQVKATDGAGRSATRAARQVNSFGNAQFQATRATNQTTRAVAAQTQQTTRAARTLNNLAGSTSRVASAQSRAARAASGFTRTVNQQTQASTRAARAEGERARATERTKGTTERATRSTRQSTTETNRAAQAAHGFARGVGNLNRRMLTASNVMKLLKWPAMAAGVGIAAAAIGNLGGGVVALTTALAPAAGAVAAFPAMFSAVAQAGGVAMLAMKGIGAALGGNKKAMERLTPTAKEFVHTLKGMKPEFQSIQEAAQRGLFPGLTAGIKSAMGNLKVFRGIAGSTGKTLGNLAREAGRALGGRAWGRDLATMARTNNVLITRLGRGMGGFATAMRHVSIAAGPLVRWLGKMVQMWGQGAAAAAKNGRETGRLQAYFERTRWTLTRLFSIIGAFTKALGGIGRAAGPAGRALLWSLDKSTEAFARLTRSARGQNAMKRYFNEAVPGVRATGRLLSSIVMMLVRVSAATQKAWVPMADTLARRVVPNVERFFIAITKAVGPSIVNALAEITDLIASLAEMGGGPLRAFINTLAAFAHVVNTALKIPVLREATLAIGALIGVFAAASIAAKVTGITRMTKAVMGLAGAYKAAAAGQAVASGAGLAGAVGGAAGARRATPVGAAGQAGAAARAGGAGRMAAAGAALSAAPLVGPLFGRVGAAASKLGPIFSRVAKGGGFLGKVFRGIGAAARFVGPWLLRIGGFFLRFAGPIGIAITLFVMFRKQIVAAVRTAARWVGRAVVNIGRFFGRLGGAIGRALAPVARVISFPFRVGFRVLSAIVRGGIRVVGAIFRGIGQIFGAVARGVWRVVGAVFRTGFRIVAGIVRVGARILRVAFWVIIGIFAVVARLVWRVVGPIFRLGFRVIAAIVRGGVRVVGAVWRGLVAVFSAVARLVWRVVGPIFRAGGRVIAAIVRGIVHVARAVWGGIRWIADVARDVWNTVMRAFRAAGRFIGGIVRGMVNVVRRVWGGFRQVIVDPVVNAFNAVFRFLGGMVGRAARIGGDIVSAIASPFRWLGRRIMEGVGAIRDIGRGIGNFIVTELNKAIPDKIGPIDLPDNPIPKFAAGGKVPGQGRGDKTHIMAEPGEFVVRRKTVEALSLSALQMLNADPLDGLLNIIAGQVGQAVPTLKRVGSKAQTGGVKKNLSHFQTGGVIPAPVRGAVNAAGSPSATIRAEVRAVTQPIRQRVQAAVGAAGRDPQVVSAERTRLAVTRSVARQRREVERELTRQATGSERQATRMRTGVDRQTTKLNRSATQDVRRMRVGIERDMGVMANRAVRSTDRLRKGVIQDTMQMNRSGGRNIDRFRLNANRDLTALQRTGGRSIDRFRLNANRDLTALQRTGGRSIDRLRKGVEQDASLMQRRSSRSVDAMRRNVTRDFTATQRGGERTADRMRRNVERSVARMGSQATRSSDRMRIGTGRDFTGMERHNNRSTQRMSSYVVKTLTWTARNASKQSDWQRVRTGRDYQQMDRYNTRTTQSMGRKVVKSFQDAGRSSARSVSQMRENVARGYQSMDRAVHSGAAYVGRATSQALKDLGGKPVRISVSAPPRLTRQRGGPIPGSGREDTVPVQAAPGEWILTRHQARVADAAVRMSGAARGLGDLVKRQNAPHRTAMNASFATPGSTIAGRPQGTQLASGGVFGHMGARGKDSLMARVGSGEAVLNAMQQGVVNRALGETGGRARSISELVKMTGQTRHATLPLGMEQGRGLPEFSGGRAGVRTPGGITRAFPRQYTTGTPEFIGSKVYNAAVGLLRRFRMATTDSYATAGHSANSNHYKGTAMDAVPGRGGTWDNVDAAVRYARSKGLHVLYNGVPNHGRGHHAHFDLAGAKGIGGVAESIVSPKIAGPKGMLLDITKRAIDKMVKGGNAYIEKKAGSVDAPHGAGGFSPAQMASLWVKAGGRRSLAKVMGAIGKAESQGNPRAQNPSSSARGLWQVMWSVWRSRFRGMDPFKPLDNAKMAVAVQRAQGLRAWEAYTRGMHRQYMQRGGQVSGPKWGGWKAQGMNEVVRRPTLIGVGEKGPEHVQVTPKQKFQTGGQVVDPRRFMALLGRYLSLRDSPRGRIAATRQRTLTRRLDAASSGGQGSLLFDTDIALNRAARGTTNRNVRARIAKVQSQVVDLILGGTTGSSRRIGWITDLLGDLRRAPRGSRVAIRAMAAFRRNVGVASHQTLFQSFERMRENPMTGRSGSRMGRMVEAITKKWPEVIQHSALRQIRLGQGSMARNAKTIVDGLKRMTVKATDELAERMYKYFTLQSSRASDMNKTVATPILMKASTAMVRSIAARARRLAAQVGRAGGGEVKKQMKLLIETINKVATARLKRLTAMLPRLEADMALRQSRFETFELRQQLAGTHEGGGLARQRYIQTNLIPALQKNLANLTDTLNLEYAKGGSTKDERVRELRQAVQEATNALLQAQLDAMEQVASNTDSLREFGGTLAFEFGSQLWTDRSVLRTSVGR